MDPHTARRALRFLYGLARQHPVTGADGDTRDDAYRALDALLTTAEVAHLSPAPTDRAAADPSDSPTDAD